MLAEFVALVTARGFMRAPTFQFLQEIVQRLEIVWVDTNLHAQAFAYLTSRQDKQYSLCDAVSFVLMEQRGITDEARCIAVSMMSWACAALEAICEFAFCFKQPINSLLTCTLGCDTVMRVIMKHSTGKLSVVSLELQQQLLERIALPRVVSRGRLPLQKVSHRLIR